MFAAFWLNESEGLMQNWNGIILAMNYLKIVEYFKQKWALTIDVFSTFTEFLSKKINKKQKKD